MPLADTIHHLAGIAKGAVRLITEPQRANTIVAEGKAELVLLAPGLLRDPYWPLHAAQPLGVMGRWPVQDYRAART